MVGEISDSAAALLDLDDDLRRFFGELEECGFWWSVWSAACWRKLWNGIEWFVVLISMFLIMNGVMSRCYLWYVLDINTHQNDSIDRRTTPSCQ